MKTMMMILLAVILLPFLLAAWILGGWFWTTDRQQAEADRRA